MDFSFGCVKLARNADPDKYAYSGYGIGFYLRSLFSIPNLIGSKMSLFLELI